MSSRRARSTQANNLRIPNIDDNLITPHPGYPTAKINATSISEPVIGWESGTARHCERVANATTTISMLEDPSKSWHSRVRCAHISQRDDHFVSKVVKMQSKHQSIHMHHLE